MTISSREWCSSFQLSKSWQADWARTRPAPPPGAGPAIEFSNPCAWGRPGSHSSRIPTPISPRERAWREPCVKGGRAGPTHNGFRVAGGEAAAGDQKKLLLLMIGRDRFEPRDDAAGECSNGVVKIYTVHGGLQHAEQSVDGDDAVADDAAWGKGLPGGVVSLHGELAGAFKVTSSLP